jgi:ParB/RepB/Spo0J family partition protein
MAEAARVSPQVVVAGTVHAKARTILASIPVASIHANPEQPRRHFDPGKLEELASSIRTRGILHPIIVKREGTGYMVMAGERRFRAAQLAGLTIVPALIRDDDPMEIAIIENVQREDLSPLEEAEGLGALSDQYGYTHEVLAELIGKSRPYVSNTLALRRLPGHIKSEYHASPDVSREILISVARAESPERQDMLWRLVKIRRLSVQRFREQQEGRPAAQDELTEIARLLRRLGRKLRALDANPLPAEQTARAAKLLARGQSRITRSLAALWSGER